MLRRISQRRRRPGYLPRDHVPDGDEWARQHCKALWDHQGREQPGRVSGLRVHGDGLVQPHTGGQGAPHPVRFAQEVHDLPAPQGRQVHAQRRPGSSGHQAREFALQPRLPRAALRLGDDAQPGHARGPAAHPHRLHLHSMVSRPGGFARVGALRKGCGPVGGGVRGGRAHDEPPPLPRDHHHEPGRAHSSDFRSSEPPGRGGAPDALRVHDARGHPARPPEIPARGARTGP
mmetsp:Transcript_67851/g.153548  ORF Transcript_67851/g.153548 Transcript_67851/m.153548 type:complete len:232 (-) Transcript_67851:18-713(-)